MSKVILKNKAVAERFDCNLEKDVMIHAKGYSGMISGINMAGAESILKDKNNFYLTEKVRTENTEEEEN